MGLNTLKVAEEIGMGSQDYNLVNLDGDDNHLLLYILLGAGGAIVIAAIVVIIIVVNRKKNAGKSSEVETEALVRDSEA